MKELWAKIDKSLVESIGLADGDNLTAELATISASYPLPRFPYTAVSPVQGQFLFVLAKAIQAKRILEVGTLCGYSASWLLRALPVDGCLTTIEHDPAMATGAAGAFAQMRGPERVELAREDGVARMRAMIEAGTTPYDMFFIDADQHHNVEFVEACMALSRPGSLLVLDNVIRAGQVADRGVSNSAVDATRRVFEMLHCLGIPVSVIQTVGVKGHDGFLLAVLDGP